MESAAVGFRVKSGWAMAVVLDGAPAAPRVAERRRVQLADPGVPDSAQPYHVALELPAREGSRAVARLVGAVERFAHGSVGDFLAGYAGDRHRLLGVGLVVGSDVDPATIANDHIRAHASEGRLFRRVIEEAAAKRGLAAAVTVEKQLIERAARALGKSEQQLKSEVAAMGRGLGGPWRSEEKNAALAAWMILASRSG